MASKARKMIRKAGNIASGVVGGLATGGLPGAIIGGGAAALRKNKPLTFRNVASPFGAGLAYGAGTNLLGGPGGPLLRDIGLRNPITSGPGGKGLGLGSLPGLINLIHGHGEIGQPTSPTLPVSPTPPGNPSSGLFNPAILAAGGGLLAAGLFDNESPETFNQPGVLDPAEQAKLDAYAKAQQEAIGRGQNRLFGDIATQRNAFDTERANLENPMLLEQAKQIRNALGSHIQSGGGTEGSGALGEALARAQERMANQRRLDSLNAFLPLTQQATGLGLQQELVPTEVQGAGLNRLFGLRDLMAERQFAANQERKKRQAELRQTMIGAGGNILAGGLGGQGGLFTNPRIS